MKNNNKNFKTKKRYTALEKKAYYTGLGVGLAGQGGPRTSNLTRRAAELMSEKEYSSYLAGFEHGQDNSSVLSGIRNKKKWF